MYPPTTDTPPTPRSSTPAFEIESLASDDDTEVFVRHYLNLEHNLTELYEQWATADSNFKKKAPKFAGVRVLRQDAWEALVGFICSSNNNIIRISQMVYITHSRYEVPTHSLLIRPNFLDGEAVHSLRTPHRPY